jgi:chemotaxis protein histidine kinase CheA
MCKRILFAAALFSGAACAQTVDINGKDFISGAGDERLADIARQAAASGKKLVVTAPTYWQDKVAAKLHAGAANANVQMSEGFFENVLVRVEDAKASPAKPDTAKADAARAEQARADQARADAARAESVRSEAAREEAERADAARAEAARAEAAKAEAARAEAARIEAARVEAARVEAARVAAEKAAVAQAEEAKVQAAKAAQNHLAQIKQGMEKNLNEGRPADGTISVEQLQKDDVLFVDESVRGVVRRGGARAQLFWLDGDLNLDRVELIPDGPNRYKLAEPVRNLANPVLRSHEANVHFTGAVPPADSAERKSLQQQFAEGRDITGTLRPADLRQGDVIYLGKGAAVVTRRSGNEMLRSWLDGELSLGQSGLLKQSAGAYRVLTDTVK